MAGDVRAMTLALLDARAPGATVCPSEVARALAGAGAAEEDWRGAMPAVHAAVDQMVANGAIRLSWKGVALLARDGPYRIGRAETQSRVVGDAAGLPAAKSIKSERSP